MKKGAVGLINLPESRELEDLLNVLNAIIILSPERRLLVTNTLHLKN